MAKSRTARCPDEADQAAGAPEEGAKAGHRARLLEILHGLSPQQFEHFCQKLLQACGFHDVTVTGRPGDRGIDGRALLDRGILTVPVLFQCKKVSGSVSVRVIRDFRGTLAGRGELGIILTTGTFTQPARAEASRPGVGPITLVDGDALVRVLEELRLGLHPVTAFEIDHAFFARFAASELDGDEGDELLDDAQMAEILADADLLTRLRRGSRDARQGKGDFVA